jgi:hypothetical protein
MGEEAVKYTVDYMRDISALSVQEIASLNIAILGQSKGGEGRDCLVGLPGHSFQFSLHKTTGFVRQIPNDLGWIFTDSDDVICKVAYAADMHKPIIICDESPVNTRVLEVICAMEDIIQPTTLR